MKKLNIKNIFIKKSKIIPKKKLSKLIISADLETYMFITPTGELKHIPIYIGFKIFNQNNSLEIKEIDFKSKNIKKESDRLIIDFLVKLLNFKKK